MDQPIEELKGVGKRVAGLLARLNISTVGDLVNHLPRRYDDYSKVSKLAKLKPGPVSAKVKVLNVTGRYVRRGLHITEAVLDDGSGSVKAVWFNQPYRERQITEDQEYFVSGSYEFNNRSYSLMNPSLEKVSDFPKNTARIVPIYKETKGLKSHTLRKLMALVDLEGLRLDTELPYETAIGRLEATRRLHFPSTMQDIESAQEFFAFEELFAVVLSSALVKAQNAEFQAQPAKFHEQEVKDFVKSLDFTLTDDQRKVAWKCFGDMALKKPMNRLVEGDVGSGKTVVATMLALNAILNNQQVSMMVPTEVLANQHFKNISKLLDGTGVKVGLYTGSLKKPPKDKLKLAISKGELDLVIGTHALIQDGVDFKALNLVVIDEQHRFGVNQRIKLVGKSKLIPHVLTMTATPIPRTLALTVFGDLDISVIAELPEGRLPIKTKLVPPNSIAPVYKLIRDEVKAGRQAFIIYPLIEESETLPFGNVTDAHKKLSGSVFKDLSVGLIHGRLKADEKDKVMNKFANGEIDILVSTTVVEVGVDVPNASVMVIEGAERFGLAQIHQLRGRVGRGAHQAYCFLVPSSSKNVSKRLRAMEEISDGFRLAEYDLELRGPGAIYGDAQHGELDVRFTTLSNPKQIAHAKELVDDFMNSGQDLVKYPSLATQVAKYKSITHLN